MYIAVDKDNTEALYMERPERMNSMWSVGGTTMKIRGQWFPIENGTIEKYLGRKLTWEDEPVEIDSHEWLEKINN